MNDLLHRTGLDKLNSTLCGHGIQLGSISNHVLIERLGKDHFIMLCSCSDFLYVELSFEGSATVSTLNMYLFIEFCSVSICRTVLFDDLLY